MSSFNFRKPLIFIDLEMSGPDPSLHQIVELSALRCDPKNFGIVDQFGHRFRAVPGKSPEQVIEEANPIALEKTGLRAQDLQFGMTPEEGVRQLKEWLPKEYIFVGYNLMLDFMFLRKVTSPEVKFNYRFIDVSTLAELYYGEDSREDKRSAYSLHSLAESLNISYGKAHSSLEDVILVVKVFEKMLKNPE